MLKHFLEEIKSHKLIYFLLSIVLVGAVFVRIYNTKEILGFYYDQGRDSIVIWNFLHKGDFFLVGPTTGIEGILRGPWYYWLILPFYFLGGGDPVWPANFLALTSVVAIFAMYMIGKEIFGRITGLIAAIIGSFSYYFLTASRWLSNPTPMLLISMLLVLSMMMVARGKKFAWIFIATLLGLSMQFGSATETFYIPAVFVFALLYRKNLPDKKIFLFSTLCFILIFLPQVVFDIFKNGILSDSIKRFLFDEQSFKLSVWEVIKIRIPFYWSVFASKIWLGESKIVFVFFVFSLFGIIFSIKEFWKKDGFKALLLLSLSPLVGMLFFQGNEGNVYDYYFTGYYFIFTLLFSAGLGAWANAKAGIVLPVYFFLLFFQVQAPAIKNYLTKGRSNINFKEQIQAVDWIYTNAKGKEFNVDIYVPPVIPYAYDYLFLWKADQYKTSPLTQNVRLLYTLYEDDIPQRLDPWISRQDRIGKVIEEISFRGITVQKRERFGE